LQPELYDITIIGQNVLYITLAYTGQIMPTEIELLQKIADNVGNNSPLLVAMVAGDSALAGALIPAILSYLGIRHTVRSQGKIERQKLQATVVSAERLRWLQDIRTRLSIVYAKMDMQFNLLQRQGAQAPTQQQLDDFSNEIMLQVNVIYLMLNPAKQAQGQLRCSLQKSLQLLSTCFGQPQQAQLASSYVTYTAIKQSAFDALTNIGTETWEKISELQ